MKLSEIAWPVYKLAKSPPSKQDDTLFYISSFRGESRVQIIDDKNIPGDTLARRRLLLDAGSIYPIKQSFFFVGDLLKAATAKQWFIDSNGKHFQLSKTKRVPLVYKKITNIIRNVGVTLIEAEGVPGRHMCLFSPMEGQSYAAFIKPKSRNYILYGFADRKYEDTYRKI